MQIHRANVGIRFAGPGDEGIGRSPFFRRTGLPLRTGSLQNRTKSKSIKIIHV